MRKHEFVIPYFKVESYNNIGYTPSNCIEITILSRTNSSPDSSSNDNNEDNKGNDNEEE